MSWQALTRWAASGWCRGKRLHTTTTCWAAGGTHTSPRCRVQAPVVDTTFSHNPTHRQACNPPAVGRV